MSKEVDRFRIVQTFAITVFLCNEYKLQGMYSCYVTVLHNNCAMGQVLVYASQLNTSDSITTAIL